MIIPVTSKVWKYLVNKKAASLADVRRTKTNCWPLGSGVRDWRLAGGSEWRRASYCQRQGRVNRTGKVSLRHKIIFSLHCMDSPTVWYIQVKVFIGIRPLRLVEYNKLFAFVMPGKYQQSKDIHLTKISNIRFRLIRKYIICYGGFPLKGYYGQLVDCPHPVKYLLPLSPRFRSAQKTPSLPFLFYFSVISPSFPTWSLLHSWWQRARINQRSSCSY